MNKPTGSKLIEEASAAQMEASLGAAAVLNIKADPAPNPTELAGDRAKQLVGNISSTAMDELRKLRDQIDAMITQVESERQSIVSAIIEHTDNAEHVIRTKIVISDALKKLQEANAKRPTIFPVQGDQSVID